MNHLKHNLHDISMLITDARVKGDVEYCRHIYTEINPYDRIKSAIYEKEDVAIYIVDTPNWWENGYTLYGYTFLYAKGIPEEDLRTIEKAVQQMLSVRR
jgi:hypothetical protein